MRKIIFRASQPILHRQEISAHVLRGARNEAQNFRQALQHLQLTRTGRGFVARVFSFSAA